ncbi:UbiD family decarboxylase [Streptomyces sp. KM273126]|uniref:UbiD family decarboxylase domain-containing protein n=1 Tax=Streptomyces sp. KM273126 TaxID=2545247 RepID=UPI00103B9258|nr:UbiD family decarboxylase [Streptomyces sp. KM273126]
MSEISDLRSNIAALEGLGDLQRVSRLIDPNLEASCVTRRSTENGRPAPFFEHLSGVAEGFRMIGAPGALSNIPGHPLARISLSLELLVVAANSATTRAIRTAACPGRSATLSRLTLMRDEELARLRTCVVPRGRWCRWSVASGGRGPTVSPVRRGRRNWPRTLSNSLASRLP